MIKRFPRLLWLVVSTPALACTASHKSITARRTPCKLHEIEISNEAYEADRETWAASCGGKRYACSTTGLERRVVYACRVLEEPNAPQEATSAASDTGGGVNAASSAPRAESAPASSTQDARVDAASRAPRAESAPASSTDAPGP